MDKSSIRLLKSPYALLSVLSAHSAPSKVILHLSGEDMSDGIESFMRVLAKLISRPLNSWTGHCPLASLSMSLVSWVLLPGLSTWDLTCLDWLYLPAPASLD